MHTTTIKEQGLKLPIGQLKGGSLVKDFTLRAYKGKLVRSLNLWREANIGKPIPHLAAKYLSLVIESAAGTAYALTESSDSTSEQLLRIHDWYWGDAMYAYVYSRIVNASEWITIPVVCINPKCRYQGEVKGDLWSTEVTVMDDPNELFTWVTLRDGIKLSTGKTCKRIKIQPVPFRAMLLGPEDQDIDGLNYAQLREAILEVEGAPPGYVVQDKDLEDLSHFDILRIDRQAGAAAAGVDLSTKVECPNCKTPLHGTLVWAFDYFFDSSVPLDILTS